MEGFTRYTGVCEICGSFEIYGAYKKHVYQDRESKIYTFIIWLSKIHTLGCTLCSTYTYIVLKGGLKGFPPSNESMRYINCIPGGQAPQTPLYHNVCVCNTMYGYAKCMSCTRIGHARKPYPTNCSFSANI